MGWIIFFCYLIYGVIMNIIMLFEKDAPEGSQEKRIVNKVFNVWLWIGIASLAIFLLYLIGLVWYFFCGGFLLFEDQPFWDKVVCGFITLIPFGFFIGIVRICCGWDPDK